MTERPLPKWRVIKDNGDYVDHSGFLEYMKFGAISFVDRNNQILKIYAHGVWREVARITDAN